MRQGDFALIKYAPTTGTDEVYDISYGGLGHLDTISGLGIGELHRLRERGPYQDGETDLGERSDTRTVQMVLMLTAATPQLLDERLDLLADIIGPDSRGFSLRRYRPDRSQRQLDLQLTSAVPMASDDATAGDVYAQRVGLTCDAPSPAWYDPRLVTVNFGLAAGTGAWDIPWAIPWNIGNSTLDQSTNVVYEGTVAEYPVIIVDGPVTNLVITNVNTGDKLDFTGATISAGQRWTIDLRYGAKTVVDATGVNRIGNLTNDSNLDSWRLLPSREIPGGINTVRVTGSAASTTTQVYLQYYRRYQIA